jgi:predicted ferric reductase
MTSAAPAQALSTALRAAGKLPDAWSGASSWPGIGSGHEIAAGPGIAGHSAIVVTSTTPLWYATRATGLVALMLLTAAMALGLLTSVRFEQQRWPRFITIGLHRSVSLLACAFIAVHVTTTVLDNFVPIGVADAFVPFISTYRPIWVGLGAIAVDLLIALTVTSLLRARLRHRTWRLVHWTAYLCWPVAVLHGFGTGSDTPTRWVLVLTLGCVAGVACLIAWRLAQGWPDRAGLRVAAAVTLVTALIVTGAWLMAGPLKPGWSHRAGLPAPQPAGAARHTSLASDAIDSPGYLAGP